MRLENTPTRSFAIVLIYVSVYYLLQFMLFKSNTVPAFPDSHSLLNWDAKWYFTIAKYGYEYSAETYSNSGFFILFPLLWKLAGLSIWGICVVNILLFAGGFALFNSIYKLKISTQLLWLTFPSIYVAFIAYSESLFIFLTCLTFWAMVKDKKLVLWIALFLLALTRPVTIIMTPAFLATELLTNDRKYWLRSIQNVLLYYALPLLLGLGLLIWYQHFVTGVWLAFYKQQEMHWGHSFSWPKLPFATVFGLRLLWLNAMALFLCAFALMMLVGYGVKWLFSNKVQPDKLLVLSSLYLTGMGLVCILFNPKWPVGSTLIYDTARYVFVTPFFWVILYRFTVTATYKWRDYLVAFIMMNVFWLTCESYQHIQKFLYFNISSIVVLLYMMQTNKRLRWPSYAILFVAGLGLQVQMLQWYLTWLYPG